MIDSIISISFYFICQIEGLTDDTQLKDRLNGSEEFNFRFDLGITDTSRRDRFISSVSLHYGVLIVKAELDQIFCGLNDTLDALRLIRDNPTLMRPLFMWAEPSPLTAESLYNILPAVLSENGNNTRECQEEILIFWNDFLENVEGIPNCLHVVIQVVNY